MSKKSGFKMKGSPMKRNFGIGSSPVKNKEESKVKSVVSADGNTMTKSKDGKVVSTFTKNPNKDFKSGKPSEQSKETWILNN